MTRLLCCCYELALLALDVGDYEGFENILFQADMIDLEQRYVIIETRYSDDQPRDEYGRWTDEGSGGYNSGAISGALKPDSEKAQEHADRYYESVRKMKNDHERIAENTEFSAEEIKQVKSFIFLEKHDLGGPEPEHFYPSYEMSQSWQRLIDGKSIQKHDITLIKHELMEKDLMAQGYSQNEAHRLTDQKYDYATESREYYAKTDKHKDE